MQSQLDQQRESVSITDGPFVTTREACDELCFSRPDSFLRSWRSAGFAIYRRPSGRCLVAVADIERFLSRDRTAG